jgi:hypothetical protein
MECKAGRDEQHRIVFSLVHERLRPLGDRPLQRELVPCVGRQPRVASRRDEGFGKLILFQQGGRVREMFLTDDAQGGNLLMRELGDLQQQQLLSDGGTGQGGDGMKKEAQDGAAAGTGESIACSGS